MADEDSEPAASPGTIKRLVKTDAVRARREKRRSTIDDTTGLTLQQLTRKRSTHKEKMQNYKARSKSPPPWKGDCGTTKASWAQGGYVDRSTYREHPATNRAAICRQAPINLATSAM